MNTKISLEIDLKDIIGTINHYDEDGDLCDTTDKDPAKEMQKIIAEKAVKHINMGDKVDSIINKMIARRVEPLIDGKINSLYDDLINKEINVTDRYGDVNFSGTVLSRLKDKFDEFLTETVNSEGKKTSDRYSSTYSRIDFIINERLKKLQSSFMDESLKKVNSSMEKYVDKVDEAVKEQIKLAVQSRIGEKLYENLDIGTLIENIKEGGK